MPRRTLLIIDRFEDDLAIITYENSTFALPCSLLPRAAKEGDVIKLAVILDTKTDSHRRKKPEQYTDHD